MNNIMSFCNRTKKIVKENVERKPVEKQWNPNVHVNYESVMELKSQIQVFTSIK